jgi:hypothetical protein
MAACNSRRPRDRIGGAGLIHREGNKKKKHMPIKKLLAEAGPVAQALKPCFMMSPLTVSQFLPPDLKFDAVIFDEASQVLPSDAINCIYRGDQLIVAGDQKQLPPTSFFHSLGEDAGEEYEEGQLDNYESITTAANTNTSLRSATIGSTPPGSSPSPRRNKRALTWALAFSPSSAASMTAAARATTPTRRKLSSSASSITRDTTQP